MKLVRSIALAALLALAPATASLADNDVGCGVGTNIMKGQRGLFPKLVASFTNGLTFQSISITFGVMGCNGRGPVTADAQLHKFAVANLDRIARDAAAGRGESLEVLSTLLGIAEPDRAAFYALTQREFVELFPSDSTTSEQMLDALDRALVRDQALSSYTRG